MPGACKNWLSVGRWAEVANADYAVTWVTLDAPLIQVGGITATLLNSTTTLDSWRKSIEPTQKLFSWAMNNHEETNYRAFQEGPVQFRFVVRAQRQPHDVAEARASPRASVSRSWSSLPEVPRRRQPTIARRAGRCPGDRVQTE